MFELQNLIIKIIKIELLFELFHVKNKRDHYYSNLTLKHYYLNFM